MHPMVSRDAFKRFCKTKRLKGKIIDHLEQKDIEKGIVFIVVSDNDLAMVVATSGSQSLILGKDIGIISYNETPLKKIIGNGITVISADFGLMGKRAAIAVKERGVNKEVIATNLIVRESI
jgi:DNA-binding LacI/PurR family transcriptional regulator